MDYGHKQADLMLKDTEKRLQKIYAQAAKETEQKVKDYYDKYATKYNAKLADLRAGKISKADFTKWNQGQIMIGKRWEEMRDTIATDLTNTNKIAASVINGHLPDVYALNHNYGTFEVEKGSKVNTSYTLYNRQAVERLVRDDPNLLPKPGVNTKKDIRWNKSNFNSGILQGILQGESIDKIAKRVALGTSSKDMSIAIRNARTAFTGAQNRGRYDSYCRAADMGIKIMKQWSAALDTHTRNSHRELDGEEVPYNEEFSNGLMYPGDPDGEPAEVYNCRCAMIADIDENLTNVDPSMINPNLANMSFDEWEDWHLSGGADDGGDILSLENCKTFEAARNYFQNRYGIKIADSVGDLDYNHVKEAMHGIDDTIKEFPELNGHLGTIGTDNVGPMCSNGRNIYFNPKYFKVGSKYDMDDAYLYRLGAHESGHCLDMILCNKAYDADSIVNSSSLVRGSRLWNKGDEAKKVVNAAVKNVKKAHPELSSLTSSEMREAISNYATKNTSETLAEAISYAMEDRRAGRVKNTVGGTLSNEIFNIVKKGVSG